MNHVPVLADECVTLLTEKQGSMFIDCTVGPGGHAEAICKSVGDSIRLLGIDLDRQALEKAKVRLASWIGVRLEHGNFAKLMQIAESTEFGDVDGVIADLGQSSAQLDNPDRGFSHRLDGKLDMRFDTTTGFTAADWMNNATRNELSAVLRDFGQERRFRRIARAIDERRPIHSTIELEQIVRRVCPGQFIEKTLARVFMALRMVVNDEPDALESMLPQALSVLKPGGRLVIISYDSNQDRPVKHFLKKSAQTCICPPEIPACVCSGQAEIKILTSRIIRPSGAEISQNPRARSAKLRAVEKL